MAYIDKIYGNRAQRRELKAFLVRNKKRKWFKYFYPVCKTHDVSALTNFPTHVDKWLWRHCDITWVRQALMKQYGEFGLEGFK